MVVTFVSSEDEQVRAVRELLRATGFTRTLALGGLAMAGGAAVIVLTAGGGGLLGWNLLVPFALLVFVLRGPIVSLRVRRQYRRDPAFQEPITYAFTSHGMRKATPLGTAEHPWMSLIRVRETPEFLFFFHGTSAAWFLPRRALSDADASRLREYLAGQPGLAIESTTPSKAR